MQSLFRFLFVCIKIHSSGISGKKRAHKEFVDGILFAGCDCEGERNPVWAIRQNRNQLNARDHGAIWICHGKIMSSKKLDVRPFLCLSVAEMEIMMLCLCLKPQEQMPRCSRKDPDYWETAVQCFMALPFVQ